MQDPRGNLTLTYLGLADKLKPRWIVYENVPGLLSINGGKDFGAFLGALVELGYGFAYRVLDAQYVGGPRAVPQRRRRVFVVACLGDWRAPAEVLSITEGVRGYLETGNKKRKSPAPDAPSSIGAGSKLFDMQAIGQYGADGVASTCKMRDYKDATDLVIKPVVIDRAAFNQGQNAQYVPHIEESEVMDSLVARGPHAVGVPFRKSKRACSTTDNEPVIVQASELRLRGQITEQDTCPTLLANTKSGDNDPLAVQAITFQPGNLRRDAGADPSTEVFPTLTKDSGDQSPHVAYPASGFKWHQGSQAGSIGYEEEVCPTITSVKEPAVIHPVVPLDGMNLLSRLGPCGEEHSLQNFEPGDPSFTLKKGGNQHGVLTPMAVRRLTPVECERLQGFPDNWSRISWKGKPEDQCPDGPRYKACGNSMAVPVMRWIGERIAAVDATL
jgi:DNA (cytosine-5)-methyltransferase 1